MEKKKVYVHEIHVVYIHSEEGNVADAFKEMGRPGYFECQPLIVSAEGESLTLDDELMKHETITVYPRKRGKEMDGSTPAST